MSKARHYFMDTEEWARRTDSLSLELQGAYLRLCNEAHRDQNCVIAGRRNFEGMFRCGNARAAALVRGLALAGMVEKLDDWTVRVLYVHLVRRSLSQELRQAVFARDGRVCRYCCDQVGPFEIDHIHPVARGGSDDLENLCVSCVPCNRSKGAKLVGE